MPGDPERARVNIVPRDFVIDAIDALATAKAARQLLSRRTVAADDRGDDPPDGRGDQPDEIVRVAGEPGEGRDQ